MYGIIHATMIPEQFNRIIRFVQTHHERLVVLDPREEEPVVVLPFTEYEDLKEPPFGEPSISPEPTELDWDNDELWNESWNDAAEESTSSLEKKPTTEDKDSDAKDFSSGLTPATEETRENPKSSEPSEDLSDIPHEEEEEKFYLEPVE